MREVKKVKKPLAPSKHNYEDVIRKAPKPAPQPKKKPTMRKKLKSGPTLKRISTSQGSQYFTSEADRKLYGNRMAEGYEKIDLLGKGGAAVVWLARHIESGEKVAIK